MHLHLSSSSSSGLKRRETFQHVISVQFKRQHLWWYGVHNCTQYGLLACFGGHYECWKVYENVLEQQMLPSRQCVFQQDNAKPHTAANSMACSRRVWVLNWLACSPDLSPVENIWHIIKWKLFKDDHQLFSSWKSISSKNGTKFECQNSRHS